MAALLYLQTEGKQIRWVLGPTPAEPEDVEDYGMNASWIARMRFGDLAVLVLIGSKVRLFTGI